MIVELSAQSCWKETRGIFFLVLAAILDVKRLAKNVYSVWVLALAFFFFFLEQTSTWP